MQSVFIFHCSCRGECIPCHWYALGCDEMPLLLNFHQKLGWQLILNPDIDDEVTEHHGISLEAIHTMCTAPRNARIYRNHHWIWICVASQRYQQFTCSWPNCNNVSKHFVHALRDHGYVVTAMLGMYWLWSSAMNESAEPVFFSYRKLAFLVMFFGTTSTIRTPQHGGANGKPSMSSTILVYLFKLRRYLWHCNFNFKLRLNSVLHASHELSVL